MATYYKYVERDAKDRINWSEVGKSLTDMLDEEARVRREKKAEIDENSRQDGIKLANAPTGDFDDGNTFVKKYVDNMSEYRLLQDRLLKSGQLNLSSYTRNRQNNTDGTKQIFDLAELYQAEYANKQKRYDDKKSRLREVWNMEQVEGLANLRTVGPYINPVNGVVNIATIDKNGGLDKNNTLTVSEVAAKIGADYDYYDVNAAVQKEVNLLGEDIKSILQQAVKNGNLNSITEITDKTDKKEYDEWLVYTKSAMLSNPDHIESILTENIVFNQNNERITFTNDETEYLNDKTGRLIFLDKSVDASGKAVFKPEQEQAVDEFLTVAIESQIDKIIKKTSAGTLPYPSGGAGGFSPQDQEDAVTLIAQLAFATTEEDLQEAIDSLEGYNPEIDIDIQGGDIVITGPGKSRTVNMSEYNSVPAFVRAHGQFILGDKKIENINDVLKAGGVIPPGSIYQTDRDFYVTGTGKAIPKKVPQTFNATFRKIEGAKIDIPIILADAKSTVTNAQQNSAISNLQAMIAEIPNTEDININNFITGKGFHVEISDGGGNIAVDLKKPAEALQKMDIAVKRIINYALKRQVILTPQEKEKYVEANKEAEKEKRTVPQIMKEDKVTQAKAIIIFNKQ